MILLIDNYDSFTYNLVHLIGQQCPDLVVKRNDAISAGDALAMGPEAIALSPGPCTPAQAGISLELAHAAKAQDLPLLGVCLGHQAIIRAAGGRIIRAGKARHGQTSPITHNGEDLFAGIPCPFTATRYHSLAAEVASLPADVRVLARAADDGEIMACRWGEAPIWGVQFHPESIASTYGDQLVANFLHAAGIKRAAA